jgi:hypothetical protein
MREARIDESVCAIDYRWPMGGTGVLLNARCSAVVSLPQA